MKYSFFSNYSDENLVSMYLTGENDAIGVIYSRYFQKINHRCISFVKDQELAHDLSHDIFLKVIDKLNTFKGDSRFSTWLYSITFNHCIEHLRKNKKISVVPFDEQHDRMEESLDIETLFHIDKKEETILSLLAEIPESDKEMLLLKHKDNCSIKDLMLMYQLSSSAVKMRLARARNKIEKLYSRNTGEKAA